MYVLQQTWAARGPHHDADPLLQRAAERRGGARGRRGDGLSPAGALVYIYVYIYIYICVLYVYIYIYIYINNTNNNDDDK